MRNLSGGCLCGQVRYAANADPALVAACHCKNHQKQDGAAFSVVVGIPKWALSVEGRLETYRDKGDSKQPCRRRRPAKLPALTCGIGRAARLLPP